MFPDAKLGDVRATGMVCVSTFSAVKSTRQSFLANSDVKNYLDRLSSRTNKSVDEMHTTRPGVGAYMQLPMAECYAHYCYGDMKQWMTTTTEAVASGDVRLLPTIVANADLIHNTSTLLTATTTSNTASKEQKRTQHARHSAAAHLQGEFALNHPASATLNVNGAIMMDLEQLKQDLAEQRREERQERDERRQDRKERKTREERQHEEQKSFRKHSDARGQELRDMMADMKGEMKTVVEQNMMLKATIHRDPSRLLRIFTKGHPDLDEGIVNSVQHPELRQTAQDLFNNVGQGLVKVVQADEVLIETKEELRVMLAELREMGRVIRQAATGSKKELAATTRRDEIQRSWLRLAR
jgi:hypothetical protein